MGQLAGRLETIVSKSEDSYLLTYALVNLGKGVPANRYMQQISQIRQRLMRSYVRNLTRNSARRVIASRQNLTKLILTSLREPLYSNERKLKQRILLDKFIQDLADEPPTRIAERMRDKNELIRLLAVKTAAKMWMPLERDLIIALADPSIEVRKAAHAGLVRLSRGTDFGPANTAYINTIRPAQKNWVTWLALQKSESTVKEVNR